MTRKNRSYTALFWAILFFGTLTNNIKAQNSPIASRWSNDVLNHEYQWYASAEAISIANSVIQYQSLQGGWPKSTDLAKPPISPEDLPKEGGGRINSLDNDATTLPMEFLARVIYVTGNTSYKNAFNRGLDYLFSAQYPTGGWPQFWPLRGDYYSRITFNDGAMIRVMTLLYGVAQRNEPFTFVDSARCIKSAGVVQLGIKCILKSQIKQNNKLTVWCAQHDEKTLKPAWGRAYEPPSLSGKESVDIVYFLMSIKNPNREIINAIEGAVSWLQKVPIMGFRHKIEYNTDGRKLRSLLADTLAPPLWARFYELGTNRPIYLDRDSRFEYDFNAIDYERRSGYDYHGEWASALLDKDYPNWRAKQFPDKIKIVEAETGVFAGIIDRHSCWHTVMLSDADHSTHSGRGAVDTKNEIGSFVEVNYDASWTGPHRITVRYTHIKQDPRPGELLVNGKACGMLKLLQSEALSAWKTESIVVDLKTGRNTLRLRALNEGGLPNLDYVKVAEVRSVATGSLPKIQVLEVEDGVFSGREDHHSCWDFIAQNKAEHTGFTGEGYVDSYNNVGSYIEVVLDSVVSDTYALGVRFVHGKSDSRAAELRINGELVKKSIVFTPTGAWTAWTTIYTQVKLRSGKNVIRLSALGAEGLVNIDHFVFVNCGI